MNKSETPIRASYRISHYTWGMVALWTVIVGALFLFNFMNIKKEFSSLARLEAVASFNKDTVYRRWATMHGGVYVPISEHTPSNPSLNVQELDISTPSGKQPGGRLPICAKCKTIRDDKATNILITFQQSRQIF